MAKLENKPDEQCYLAMEISRQSVESASSLLLTVDNKMQQDISKLKERLLTKRRQSCNLNIAKRVNFKFSP